MSKTDDQPAGMTPAERTLRARAAANAQWAAESDWSARTAPARAGFEARFDRMVVEKHGELPPAQHAKHAAAERARYFAELARKSAKARRTRSGTTAGPKASTT